MEVQQKKKKYDMSLGRRIGYGTGQFATNIFSTAVGSFLTAYYTDSIMLAAAWVGVMMLVTRLLDGVSDLVMGAVIDKTYTKWGKARPWVAIVAIPFAISFILMFNVPSSLTGGALKTYVVVTYILHTIICGTIANVALNTLNVKVTEDGATRASAISISNMFCNLAIFVGNTYTASIMMYFGGERRGYLGMSILYSVIAVICLLICFFCGKEYRVETKEQEQVRMEAAGITRAKKGGTKELLAALFGNRYVIPMAVAFALNWLAISINGGGQVYYCRDVLGSMRYMGQLAMARSIPSIIFLAIGVMPIFIRMFGKKKGLIICCAVQVIAHIVMWLAPLNPSALIAGNILKGCFQGLTGGLLFATVADVADYVDLKNNVSLAGMTSSITSFGMKIGVGLGSALIGWILAWGNYNPANIPTGMPPETIAAEKIIYIMVPAICLIGVLLCSLFVDVDKKLPELRAAHEDKKD